jgi:hypothetical protein
VTTYFFARFTASMWTSNFSGIMTWDPKEKSHESYTFGNNFPGCRVQSGNSEGDALV